MSNYTTRQGDTFDSISRKLYGVETEADSLRYANPQIKEPIAAGLIVNYLPTSATLPTSREENPDRVELRVAGKVFKHWESVTLTRSLDSLDTIEIIAPFDPDDVEQRQAFRPFAFQVIEALIGGARVFRGTLVQVSPQSDANATRVTLSGYALAGALSDCSPPPDMPLEFNGWTLKEIAAELCRPFGLTVTFDAEVGPAFDRVKCARTDRVLEFLSELARQRSGVWSNTADGGLVFRKSSDTAAPVATLRENSAPLESVRTNFNAQAYYSQVNGFEPIGTGTRGSVYTVNNPRVSAVRPHTFTVADATGGDVKTATEAAAGRMFGSAAPYMAALTTWRTPGGELWAPDQTITVHAPRAMIYTPYKFKVRAVALTVEPNRRTAALELMLPGCLAGEIPETLPWD